MKSVAVVLFAALAAAAPGQLDERGLSCSAVTSILSIMKATKVATPFCSSYLGIKPTTITSTLTSTPCAVTTTTTISSTDTVTSTSVVTSSSTTTVGVFYAVSTTSTCGLSQTVIQSSSPTANQKRGVTTTTKCTTSTTSTTTKCTTTYTPSPKCTTYSPPPVGTPTCLTKYPASTLSSACSCLAIPTPTKVVYTTKTLTASTVTSTVCSTAKTTTVVTTTTTTVSTYTASQYYTSTFTVLPPPSSTVTASSAPTQSFGAYPGLDFNGNDLQSFNCYPNGPPVPSGFAACNGFEDCVNNCAIYQQASGTNTSCGAVVFNAPADLSSGYCYLKTAVYGCGSPNDNTKTGVILPLVAYDPQ